MSYVYSYEAQSYISDISLHLDEAYLSTAMTMTVIFSIIAFALVMFTAIAIKRARPYGVVVAIAQPLGLFAAMKIVEVYASIDFSCMEITKYSSVSLDDAMNKLDEALADAFIENIFPKMMGMFPWMFLLLATFVLTLVYAIMLFKVKGKGLAIAAMIILIFKYLFMNPVEMFSLILQSGSPAIQSGWDMIFRLAYLFPLCLLAIQGVINLVAAKKKGVEAPAAAPAEQPAEEKPAE